MIVGITGGIGSGKSAVTSRFESLGITVVDADLAARVVVEPGQAALAAIAERFGAAILLDDGSLDRAALRQKVFSSQEERRWLEQLTHPLIGQEILSQLQAAQSPYAILASPLLLETSQKDLADKVGLTASSISQLENNQISPTMNNFLLICKASSVSVRS